jgi:hypothetical protein
VTETKLIGQHQEVEMIKTEVQIKNSSSDPIERNPLLQASSYWP